MGNQSAVNTHHQPTHASAGTRGTPSHRPAAEHDPARELARLQAELDGLRTAMESRAVIEQAKGLIIATTGLGPDAAFELLVRQSQSQNMKLHDVAQRLVHAAVRTRPVVDPKLEDIVSMINRPEQ